MKTVFKFFALTACLLLSVSLVAPQAMAGQLVIKGSTTVLPYAQKAAEAYMKARPDVAVSLSGGGSGNGIKAIVDGTTDIANASRFIKDSEVQMAMNKKRYPVPFRVALDCIVPVVHKDNSVKDLSMDDLKNIYTGKAKNWKEFGGPDLGIVVVSRDTSSGTYEVWEELVLRKEMVTPRALTVASNGAMVQTVAGTKGAIGYIGMGYLNDAIKQLTVNSVLGTEETTRSGQYAISRPLFMFTNGWPTGVPLDFINFIFSPTGQKLAREVGNVPVFNPGN
ncbi:phosphate ABC transporter substrate-binding protein [Desulfosudis oleivorans]|uniref:Phosphate-binding protein n=1 Tax=Desulfosudis oleivorans (strain DSM 6200 / JCM 39069 / Hxd3) TaxID=96561 RepID=A8ZSJ2_DESOH|nr:phosphate ABC transporter substrate-binding protein [Desulfosudis oleivorans]ABW67729.1 phosphate binding protein [Desulfosudis oleivorans Hxd3]